ncbi:SpoVG family protein [Ruminococcus sp. Marseille-P6503]|uniref:SpoVG family protein n=1 Tax=Ruminococcus sp. Marseille-P6503 TaxID=2364796 RepID=UPI000F53DD3A|nr:SpoVG family protein [Ruminococcus sp. Marseille-P6503]
MKISATINRLVDKPESNIKAYASVSFDGFYAVHGLRVMETEKGRFVNMPSTSYTDRDGSKQYSDIFHAITKSARNALNQAVLNAYDIKLQQVQAAEIEVENTPNEEMADELSDEPEPEIAM